MYVKHFAQYLILLTQALLASSLWDGHSIINLGHFNYVNLTEGISYCWVKWTEAATLEQQDNEYSFKSGTSRNHQE